MTPILIYALKNEGVSTLINNLGREAGVGVFQHLPLAFTGTCAWGFAFARIKEQLPSSRCQAVLAPEGGKWIAANSEVEAFEDSSFRE